EGVGDRGRDHVVVDGVAGASAGGGVGEAQHVVLGAGGLGDVEDVLEKWGGHRFAFRPRVAAGDRQSRRSVSLAPTWVRRWSYSTRANSAAFTSNMGSISSCHCSTQNSSRSEEHTSELQSRFDLVCRLLLEKK